MPSQKMLKLILAGDGGVGKTTLIKRYLTGLFSDSTKVTIGVDLFKKEIDLGDFGSFLLQIWDFGGEERFRHLLPPYMIGAHGVMFLYSITDVSSLFNFNVWLDIFRHSKSDIPILFVGSKADLRTSRKIQTHEGKSFAQKKNCSGFIEVSSKTGLNVEKAFEMITKEMWLNISNPSKSSNV